jgi:hypothetical protein
MHDRFERDKWFYMVLGLLVRNGFLKLSGRHRTWARKDVRITVLADHTLRKVKQDGRTYVHRDISLEDARDTIAVAWIDSECPD